LSRTNSYDFEPGIGRDSEVVYYRERHLVPIEDVKVGLVRFNFLLETSAPGVNYINVLHTAFTRADPISAKETDGLTVFYCPFGICVH